MIHCACNLIDSQEQIAIILRLFVRSVSRDQISTILRPAKLCSCSEVSECPQSLSLTLKPLLSAPFVGIEVSCENDFHVNDVIQHSTTNHKSIEYMRTIFKHVIVETRTTATDIFNTLQRTQPKVAVQRCC